MCRLFLAHHAPTPEPAVHDEFSYLLGADTFSQGRLTNPAHPLGRFFESPHILVRPTYASKYQPGQALVLAAGQVLFGSPFAGVVLSGALMVFQFTLLLCAWTSLRWAAAVAAAIGVYLLPPMYWADSYWGGCVAATGAAAVLFGIGRYRSDRWRCAGVFVGSGLLILFLTRPWEGSVCGAAALATYGWELWRERREKKGRERLRSPMVLVAVTGLLVCAGGAVADGFYNRAVTGNAWEPPYLLHDRQYNVTPPFWFLPLRREPPYSHPRLAAHHGLHGWESVTYHRPPQPLRRAVHAWTLLGPVAALMVLLPFGWRDRRVRMMLLILGACMLALAIEVWGYIHYAAPAAAPLAVLLAVLAERASGWRWRGWPAGGLLALALVGTAVAVSASQVMRTVRATRAPAENFGQRRAAFMNRMSSLEGLQLVIVHYPSPAWDVGEEWVYNGADIDGQKVVMAHDLGSSDNAELLHYYPGRHVWLLTPGDRVYQLRPYLSPER